MRVLVSFSFLVLLLVAATLMAADKSTAAEPKAIANASELPKTLDELPINKTIHVKPELKTNFFSLLSTAPDTGAVCHVECDHEVGGIQCGTGTQCTCGCIAGYARCECK